jgi:hypothetical protein
MGSHAAHYADSALEPMCKCDHYTTAWGNQEHCMQSRENFGGAQVEGFAQAFAARTFNYTSQTNASFVYYKPFMTDIWGSVDYPPVWFDAYSPALWMETNCFASNRGVEMDWMNFYYRVAAESASTPVSFTQIFGIYNRACTGNPATKCDNQTVSWSGLSSSALTHFGGSTSNPYYRQFTDWGSDSGVAY